MTYVVVATFNVNYICKGDGCPNAQKVASCIEECEADIVCLQESNAKWEGFLRTGDCSRRLRTIYPHVHYHNHSNDWGGFAVLSKHPIDHVQAIPETDKGWYPAGLATVRVPKRGGNEDLLLQILIVHLRAPVQFSIEPYWWGGHVDWVGGYFSRDVKARRLNEIQTFAGALQRDVPFVVVGDFNERGSSSPCLNFLEERLGMMNLSKKSTAGCCYTKNSWSFRLGGLTLLSFDYDNIVYCPRHLEPAEKFAFVHRDGGSDHRLVSTNFRFLE